MKKYFKADLHNKHLVMVTTGYGAVVEPHTHDYFEMVYVLGGRAEQIICGSHYIISSGDYFLIDIGQDHEYRRASERELPIINVLFSPRLIDTGARPDDTFQTLMRHRLLNFNPSQLTKNPAGMVFRDNDGEIRTKFTRMLEAWRTGRPGFKEYIRAELLSVLIPMLQSVIKPLPARPQREFVGWLADQIECNYAQQLSLSELCRSINYSLPYVSKCFKAGTGMNFSEYLQKVRVTNSCALLCDTELPVEEICRLVGYSNTAFFHRIFKQIVGLTPLEYRKLSKNRQT